MGLFQVICPRCGATMQFITDTPDGDKEYQCPDCTLIEVY